MIAARLSNIDAIERARPVQPYEVPVGDRRLSPMNLEEHWCRGMALALPDAATFVQWPDLSLGFIWFAPAEIGNEAIRRDRLLEQYRLAREALELMALDVVSNRDLPQ